MHLSEGQEGAGAVMRPLFTHLAAALVGIPAALAIQAAMLEPPPPPTECRDTLLQSYRTAECPHPQHHVTFRQQPVFGAAIATCECPRKP